MYFSKYKIALETLSFLLLTVHDIKKNMYFH